MGRSCLCWGVVCTGPRNENTPVDTVIITVDHRRPKQSCPHGPVHGLALRLEGTGGTRHRDLDLLLEFPLSSGCPCCSLGSHCFYPMTQHGSELQVLFHLKTAPQPSLGPPRVPLGSAALPPCVRSGPAIPSPLWICRHHLSRETCDSVAPSPACALCRFCGDSPTAALRHAPAASPGRGHSGRSPGSPGVCRLTTALPGMQPVPSRPFCQLS